MEKMAVRSTLDSTLIMNDTTTEVSVDFKRNSIEKYSYDSSMDKIQGYVYSLVEAICFQCGFFSWEELRKLKLIIIQYIFHFNIYYRKARVQRLRHNRQGN